MYSMIYIIRNKITTLYTKGINPLWLRASKEAVERLLLFTTYKVDPARQKPFPGKATKERFGENPETDHPASRPAYDSSRSKRNRRDTGFVPRHVLESQLKYGKFYDMFASAQKERAGAETVVLNNSLPSAPDYPQNVSDAYAGYAATDRLD